VKRAVFVLISSLFCSYLFAQHTEEAENLVREGVSLEDSGKSELAITQYQRALDLDKDNLMALTEMAYSLLSVGQYEEVIKYCKKAIKTHKGEEDLKIVYVSYGNAYDMLKKTDKSIGIYDEGIRLFPEYFQLYYNKGVSLSGENKNEEAITCFEKSATLNPNHASSHNAIGNLLLLNNQKVPALLAFCRFLAIEPESKRSGTGLENVHKIMDGNVSVSEKKSITVNISPDMLEENMKNGKQKSNNFSSTELLLAVSAGLAYDSSNRNKTEVEQFKGRFEAICGSLKETEKDNYGFYWDYYVPYFTDMNDKGLIETFSYLAFASSGDPDVLEWLKSHKAEISNFYKWSDVFAWRIN